MDKYQNFIIKLNKLTKDKELIWEAFDYENSPDSLEGGETLKGKTFETSINGKKLRLYKLHRKYYRDEELYDLVTSFRLDFIDGMDMTEWSFPEYSSLADLYDTVIFNNTNVDEFIDDFLNN